MNDAETNETPQTEPVTPVITNENPVITENAIPDFRTAIIDLPTSAVNVEIKTDFELNGIKYVLLDYENEFTLKHYKVAKPYLTELLNLLYSQLAKINADEIQNQTDLQIGFHLMQAFMNFENDLQLLALLYTEPDEKIFNKANYEKRISEFENMNDKLYSELAGAVTNFLSLKIAFTQLNANTYLKAIMQK